MSGNSLHPECDPDIVGMAAMNGYVTLIQRSNNLAETYGQIFFKAATLKSIRIFEGSQ
jgi:hypothetical protein